MGDRPTTSSCWTAEGVSFWRRLLLGSLSLLMAAALWLPTVHFFHLPNLASYRPAEHGARSPENARALAARHLKLWEDPERRQIELAKMRGSNAEWDFMGRTFLVLALANMSLRDPDSTDRHLAVIDLIIEDTEKLEKEAGQTHFLMNYGKSEDYRAENGRSIFVDGEIAMMVAARRVIREHPGYVAPLQKRVDHMIEQMRQSPVLCGESYPNECWMFCNTVALCAIKTQGLLDGQDHEPFIREWLRVAKGKLLHPESGMLISSFAFDGQWYDGPEGSSIWMTAHNLQLLDEDFARDQYQRAREQLVCRALGFTYAREWPPSWPNVMDVDSGPVIPVFDASPGSSGMAFIGAGAFDDRPLLAGLLTSLRFAAFPERDKDGLRYHASNQVGDAVLLYSLVQGPLNEKILGLAERSGREGVREEVQ